VDLSIYQRSNRASAPCGAQLDQVHSHYLTSFAATGWAAPNCRGNATISCGVRRVGLSAVTDRRARSQIGDLRCIVREPVLDPLLHFYSRAPDPA
jgi:hypothetical protein